MLFDRTPVIRAMRYVGCPGVLMERRSRCEAQALYRREDYFYPEGATDLIVPAITWSQGFDGSRSEGFEIGFTMFTPPGSCAAAAVMSDGDVLTRLRRLVPAAVGSAVLLVGVATEIGNPVRAGG